MSAGLRYDTDEVFNQSPPYLDVDLFASDAPLVAAVKANGAGGEAAALSAFGRQWGSAEMFALARQANENSPKLVSFDSKGFRRDIVEFHPAYHELMRASVAAGLHASTWMPSGERAPPPSEVARAARYYMTAQVESGHLCPITMTRAALAPLAAEPALLAPVAAKVVTRTYDPTFRPWWQKDGMTLGMGMTEKQGGTDVRANTTSATPAGDHYTVTGHKWFMSAPMCDAFLVLAQAPGGLTCFFMPRFLPDGSVNALRLQRLKDKLGNRSNASSEVEFAGASAWRVGEEGAGIRTIIQMVQLTRLDCVAASAGFMRMALAQAVHHCRYRSVFQKHLYDQPMMHTVLADLALEVEGGGGADAAARPRLRPRGFRSARGRVCAARHAGGEILGVQDRARLHLRGDGMPRRQRLCRGKYFAAALPRGAGQRDLGRFGQRHVPRRFTCAQARSGRRRRRRRAHAGHGGIDRCRGDRLRAQERVRRRSRRARHGRAARRHGGGCCAQGERACADRRGVRAHAAVAAGRHALRRRRHRRRNGGCCSCSGRCRSRDASRTLSMPDEQYGMVQE